MERWHLDLGRLGSIRLHHWFRSDDKRFKHDHPSDFITLILKGSYTDLGSIAETCGVCGGEPERYAPCACNGTGIVWRRGQRAHDARHGAPPPRRASPHRGRRPRRLLDAVLLLPQPPPWGFWVPRRLDGILKFKKANKFFLEHGHHPMRPAMSKLIDRLLRKHERAAIRHFLQEAYLDHEITPGRLPLPVGKLERLA
jgi:hypothetical protein